MTGRGKPYNAARMDAVSIAAPSALAPSVVEVDPSLRPAWRLGWLTPGVCRCLFALLLLLGATGHVRYLTHDCPIDLSGDEAQYWDWSRALDLSYYSKGPLVAYIIRASCAVFGDTMPAVRYPALLLGVMTSVVTYLLALRLFRSDRVALGTVLLYHVVPMFVAGSVLMTIDPPFFFCWALATYLLTFAVFDRDGGAGEGAGDGRRWPWVAVGVVAGVGFLAKYAMFLWFLPALIALAVDRPSRRWLRSPWPWASIAIAAMFTLPVVFWNARHGWVSAKHVGTQTGTSHGHFSFANVLELLGGQIAIIGPGLFLIMIGACLYAFRRRTASGASVDSAVAGLPPEPAVRQMRFLAVFGIAFFGLTFLTAFRAKVQMNWPAPAYFTLMILSAYFLSTRLATRATWKPWRGWFWGTVVFGVLMLPFAHDPGVLYPVVRWANTHLVPYKAEWAKAGGWRKLVAKRLPEAGFTAQQVDFTYKLKGWAEAGRTISADLKALGPGAFALCHDYQQAAGLAFYLDGQPKTYYAASYYHEDTGRMTQYDLWPDRDLGPDSPLVGKNAIFLGRHDKPFSEIVKVFDRVEGVKVTKAYLADGKVVTKQETRAITIDIAKDDVKVRTFRYFRCYGFKGMTRLPESKLPH
ncbi:MAG: phospholipid carrier-dependent glycosyltransferase [Phycisphaerales bacterium]|nr:phospholipid carrier-dependent glycosyltransferase [Phycisphaerales bacterium]